MIIRSMASLVKIRIPRRTLAALGCQSQARAPARAAENDEVGHQCRRDAQPSPVVQVEGPLHGLEEREDSGP